VRHDIFLKGNFIRKNKGDRALCVYDARIINPEMRARGRERMQLELKTKKETPPRAPSLQGFFTDRRYVSLCDLITSAEIRRGLGCVNATGGWRAPFPPSSPLRPCPVPSSWALLKPVYRLFYLIESRGLLFKVLKFKSSARPLPSAIDMRNIAGLPDSPAPSARPPLMASDAMKIRKRAGPSRKKETGERVRDGSRLKRLRRRVISPIHKTYIHIGDGERGGWVCNPRLGPKRRRLCESVGEK